MKKIIFLISVTISLLLFSVVSYAGNLDTDLVPLQAGNLEITGGISGREVEATFDTYRTVTGVAERGTAVTISVYISEDEDELTEIYRDTIIIGRSGVFSSDIDLEEGENYITITAKYDDEETVIEVIINRKSLNIKQEIEEQSIIIPGLNIIRTK